MSKVQTVGEYQAIRPMYEDFALKLKTLIEALLEQSTIKFQVVEHRTKTVGSFREKITRANKNYSDPMRDIKIWLDCG
jgi:ppGpp synthetase/RelA/SpoT-type nucleotidyltranferase